MLLTIMIFTILIFLVLVSIWSVLDDIRKTQHAIADVKIQEFKVFGTPRDDPRGRG